MKKAYSYEQNDLLTYIDHAQQTGAETALILVCEGALTAEQQESIAHYNATVILENIPFDAAGILPTIALKMTLNLISNGSMVMMNKVYGNRMIDVNPSNNKLIDRCMRLTKDIWSEYSNIQIDDAQLYEYILALRDKKYKKLEQGIYTPSTVNCMLNILYSNKTPADFEELIRTIADNNERLDFLV